MRRQILKLKRGKSTKAERVFAEILKELRIPFRTKVKIGGREVDFLVGNLAIEISGHEQIITKNSSLLENGYSPVHFANGEVLGKREEIKNQLLQWQESLRN